MHPGPRRSCCLAGSNMPGKTQVSIRTTILRSSVRVGSGCVLVFPCAVDDSAKRSLSPGRSCEHVVATEP